MAVPMSMPRYSCIESALMTSPPMAPGQAQGERGLAGRVGPTTATTRQQAAGLRGTRGQARHAGRQPWGQPAAAGMARTLRGRTGAIQAGSWRRGQARRRRRDLSNEDDRRPRAPRPPGPSRRATTGRERGRLARGRDWPAGLGDAGSGEPDEAAYDSRRTASPDVREPSGGGRVVGMPSRTPGRPRRPGRLG